MPVDRTSVPPRSQEGLLVSLSGAAAWFEKQRVRKYLGTDVDPLVYLLYVRQDTEYRAFYPLIDHAESSNREERSSALASVLSPIDGFKVYGIELLDESTSLTMLRTAAAADIESNLEWLKSEHPRLTHRWEGTRLLSREIPRFYASCVATIVRCTTPLRLQQLARR